MRRGEATKARRRRRVGAALTATVIAAACHVGLPGATADASVAVGECTVGGSMQFLDGIRAVPALGQPVTLEASSTVSSCKGVLPAGNDVITLQLNGTMLLGCGVIEGTGALSIQFGPQTQQPFVGQAAVIGEPVVGGFAVTLVPQPNPLFAGAVEFVVTSVSAAACVQGSLWSVNVTGVLEFASNG